MPTRDRAPDGAPCWVDLSTSDVDRARDFYSTVLGWSAETPSEEFGGYFMFTRDGVPVAGAVANMSPAEHPDAWSVYLCVGDAGAAVTKATEHGAGVVVPDMKVGDVGTMGMLADPSGAAIGIWAPDQFAGFAVRGEPGTPVWFELHTSQYDKALAFYRDVFDWTTKVVSDTEEFRYTTAQDGEESVAGIWDATTFFEEGEGSHWRVYFGVNDTDVAVATVLKLGGSVVRPAQDSAHGRVATVADPMGSQFGVLAG